MQTIKTWILTFIIAFCFLAVFSYDDGLQDQQISAQVERESIAQAKAQKKAALHKRIEDANHMLGLK